MIIGKEFKFESSHFLPFHDKCGSMHGHTYKVKVEVEGPIQEPDGIVMDLNDLSQSVKEVIENFDHDCLNNFFLTPTCENIAEYLFTTLQENLKKVKLHSVLVQEGEGGYAICRGE